MARIRSIKEDVFHDDTLSEVSIEAHLLLVGLPVWADSAGRLEDRPRKISARVFPYRPTIDVNSCLAELAQSGHIIRYEADGEPYIQIVDWEKNQRPHIREPESVIPAPRQENTEHRQSRATSGRHPGDITAKPAGIKDSGSGIKDSGLRDLPPSAFASAAGGQGELLPDTVPASPPPEALQEIWNRLAQPKGLQRWSAMGKRKDTARARLKAEPRLEAWEAFLKAKLAEPFFLGENDRRWKADVDWLLRAERPAQVTDFADSPMPPRPPSGAQPQPSEHIHPSTHPDRFRTL